MGIPGNDPAAVSITAAINIGTALTTKSWLWQLQNEEVSHPSEVWGILEARPYHRLAHPALRYWSSWAQISKNSRLGFLIALHWTQEKIIWRDFVGSSAWSSSTKVFLSLARLFCL